MKLRLTKEEDILELSTWFKTNKEIKNWGGPLIRFPYTIEEFKKDIGWNIITSYSLVKNDKLLGFVQVFDKYGYTHIGRVVIHPNNRTCGLGTKLMIELFKEYADLNQDYSLYVYKNNRNAKKLYENLGFIVCDSQTNYENENNCYLMKKTIVD